MRKEAPPGREIAEKARAAKFDRKKEAQGEKSGKKVRFRGTDLTHVTTLDELEDGQVIGELDTELEGDETGLPAGKYNIFAAKVDGEWQVYAEAGGEVVGKAVKVKTQSHSVEDRHDVGAAFSPDGWCVYVCLVPVLWWCVYGVWFCF